jgi:amino acid permease
MIKKYSLDIKLALYCSSIIIGAGLLTLALAAAWVGLLPLLIAIVLIGAYMAFVYRLLTENLYAYLRRVARRKLDALAAVAHNARGGNIAHGGLRLSEADVLKAEISKPGARPMSGFARNSGLGKAAWTALVLGMLFYVLPADVSYVTYGSKSLNSIAKFISIGGPAPFAVSAVLGAAAVAVAWNFEQLLARSIPARGTLKKVTMMFGVWCLGVSALGVAQWLGLLGPAGYEDTAASLLGVMLFTGAVIAGMVTKEDNTQSAEREITDYHRVNIIMATVEMALLIITVGVAWWIAARNGMVAFEIGFAPGAFMPSLAAAGTWARMIGLVIFAFVGTGLFNLCVYPTLFDNSGGKHSPRLTRVVILGTFIPMIVYLVWTVTSTAVLTPSELATLDAKQEYTTIGMRDKFAVLDPTGAWLIMISGYFVALLAVTSACNGFTESLADTLSEVLDEAASAEEQASGRQKIRGRLASWFNSSPENLRLRFAVLFAAVGIAILVSLVGSIDISGLLSVAGNAGGGVLILMLPYFLPPPGRPQSTWTKVVAGTFTAFVLTMLIILAIDFASVNDLVSWVQATITVLIAFSITCMAFWLLQSEPGVDASGDNLTAGLPPHRPELDRSVVAHLPTIGIGED